MGLSDFQNPTKKKTEPSEVSQIAPPSIGRTSLPQKASAGQAVPKHPAENGDSRKPDRPAFNRSGSGAEPQGTLNPPTLPDANPPHVEAAKAPQAERSEHFSKELETYRPGFVRRSPEARLLRFKRQATARKLLPDRPVARCRRIIAVNPATGKRFDRITVMESRLDGSLYTGRLWACKSTWECPPCQASRASEFLDRLLPALENNHNRFGYGMETLTAANKKWIPVDEFIGKFKKATDLFYGGRWREDFNRRWHVRGRVTGQDITIGENGPHYHQHSLVVVDKAPFWVTVMPDKNGDMPEVSSGLGLNEWRAAQMWYEASQRWVECCASVGLYASLEHGYHIEGANRSAAYYIARLGMEIGLYANKTGKGGRTLGELLDAAGRDAGVDDELAGRQWVETVQALKGTPYLKASRGLWALLAEKEPKKKEEDTSEESDQDRVIAELPRRDWYSLLKDDRRQEWLEAQSRGLAPLIAFCGANRLALELVGEVQEENAETDSSDLDDFL